MSYIHGTQNMPHFLFGGTQNPLTSTVTCNKPPAEVPGRHLRGEEDRNALPRPSAVISECRAPLVKPESLVAGPRRNPPVPNSKNNVIPRRREENRFLSNGLAGHQGPGVGIENDLGTIVSDEVILVRGRRGVRLVVLALIVICSVVAMISGPVRCSRTARRYCPFPATETPRAMPSIVRWAIACRVENAENDAHSARLAAAAGDTSKSSAFRARTLESCIGICPRFNGSTRGDLKLASNVHRRVTVSSCKPLRNRVKSAVGNESLQSIFGIVARVVDDYCFAPGWKGRTSGARSR